MTFHPSTTCARKRFALRSRTHGTSETGLAVIAPIVLFGIFTLSVTAHGGELRMTSVVGYSDLFIFETDREGVTRGDDGSKWFYPDILAQDPDANAFFHLGPFDPGEGAGYLDPSAASALRADARSPLENTVYYDVHASTYYDAFFKSESRMTETVKFKFVIHGGEVRIHNFADWGDEVLIAGAGIAVRDMLGQGEWAIGFRLGRDTEGNPQLINGHGNIGGFKDTLGLGFPTITVSMDGPDAVAMIPYFEREVPISLEGFFLTEPELLVETDIQIFSNSTIGERVTGSFGTLGDPYAMERGEPAAGVEFFLNGQPLAPSMIIPEPATTSLLATGLLAAAGWRKPRHPTSR